MTFDIVIWTNQMILKFPVNWALLAATLALRDTSNFPGQGCLSFNCMYVCMLWYRLICPSDPPCQDPVPWVWSRPAGAIVTAGLSLDSVVPRKDWELDVAGCALMQCKTLLTTP